MDQHQEWTYQPGEDMELQPFRRSPPARASAAFAPCVQRFRCQHQNKAKNSQGMPKKVTCAWDLPQPDGHKQVEQTDQDDRNERHP